MRLKCKITGGTLTARLSGELDQHSAQQIRAEIDNAAADPSVRRLVFDMNGLEFMDSAGIGVILGRYKRIAARGGSFEIVNAHGSVEKLLRISGVYSLCGEGGGK